VSIAVEGASMCEDDPDDDAEFNKFSLRFLVIAVVLATFLTICGGPPDLFLFSLWPE
jgi:hypothetical protein